MKLIVAIFFLLSTYGQCSSETTVKGGWYLWDPYQYLKDPTNPNSLTGLDVELSKLIMKKAGLRTDIAPVSWKEHQENIRDGTRDFAMGAFRSDDRAEYAYLPRHYRYEEDSLFVRREDASRLKFSADPEEFLKFVKEKKLKIGIVDGYRYGDEKINAFIEDPSNKDLITRSKTDNSNLKLLLNKHIDGFLADRIVGATIIWREKVGRHVTEKQLNIKAPIYMLLSKKSISEKTFQEIDKAIEDVKNSPDYTKTVSWYLYPILLLTTTDSNWFIMIEFIGMIAFAISGLVIAFRTNATLFGGFILCLLPSFGGGVLRDIIFGRFPIWFLQARSYLYIVTSIAVFGFILIRLATRFFHGFGHGKYKRFFDYLLIVTDAIGLAAFTVTGVVVSLIVKADPLWLWGPFFAFLTGAGGGMIRDIVVQKGTVDAIKGELYPEIAIIWGFFLSLYLSITAMDVDPDKIEIAVILTIVCAFFSRIIFHFCGIKNLYFNPAQQIEDIKSES